MHDSADGALRFASHRDDEAAISNRDRHVGDALVRFQLRHRTLQQLDQLALGSFELAPDFFQRRGGVIVDLAILIDRALNGVLDRPVAGERVDLSGKDSSHYRRYLLAAQRFAGYPRATEQRADDENVGSDQGSAFNAKSSEGGPGIGNGVKVPRLFRG